MGRDRRPGEEQLMRIKPSLFGLMIVAVFAATIGIGAALGAWQTVGGPASGSGGGHGGGRGGGTGDGDSENVAVPSTGASAGWEIVVRAA
jgi:hypothetical protein